MNPEIKAKWIEALRSGKYNQTRGALARTRGAEPFGEGMCCLGVLCDIVDPKGWRQDNGNFSFKSHYDCDALPSTQVLEKVDADKRDIILMMNRLAVMNDGGKSFTEIAAYIEEEL